MPADPWDDPRLSRAEPPEWLGRQVRWCRQGSVAGRPILVALCTRFVPDATTLDDTLDVMDLLLGGDHTPTRRTAATGTTEETYLIARPWLGSTAPAGEPGVVDGWWCETYPWLEPDQLTARAMEIDQRLARASLPPEG